MTVLTFDTQISGPPIGLYNGATHFTMYTELDNGVKTQRDFTERVTALAAYIEVLKIAINRPDHDLVRVELCMFSERAEDHRHIHTSFTDQGGGDDEEEPGEGLGSTEGRPEGELESA